MAAARLRLTGSFARILALERATQAGLHPIRWARYLLALAVLEVVEVEAEIEHDPGILALLVLNTELVIGDDVVLHDKAMAQQGGAFQLAHERVGELFERVREDNHLCERPKFREELQRPVQGGGQDQRIELQLAAVGLDV